MGVLSEIGPVDLNVSAFSLKALPIMEDEDIYTFPTQGFRFIMDIIKFLYRYKSLIFHLLSK